MHLGIKANIPLQIISQINHILFQNTLLFQQCLQCQNQQLSASNLKFLDVSTVQLPLGPFSHSVRLPDWNTSLTIYH